MAFFMIRYSTSNEAPPTVSSVLARKRGVPRFCVSAPSCFPLFSCHCEEAAGIAEMRLELLYLITSIICSKVTIWHKIYIYTNLMTSTSPFAFNASIERKWAGKRVGISSPFYRVLKPTVIQRSSCYPRPLHLIYFCGLEVGIEIWLWFQFKMLLHSKK